MLRLHLVVFNVQMCVVSNEITFSLSVNVRLVYRGFVVISDGDVQSRDFSLREGSRRRRRSGGGKPKKHRIPLGSNDRGITLALRKTP